MTCIPISWLENLIIAGLTDSEFRLAIHLYYWRSRYESGSREMAEVDLALRQLNLHVWTYPQELTQ